MSFLAFKVEGTSASGKTKVWSVQSKHGLGFIIATVSWYAPWRKYTFKPNSDTVWDDACLNEMAAFLSRVNREHKE